MSSSSGLPCDTSADQNFHPKTSNHCVGPRPCHPQDPPGIARMQPKFGRPGVELLQHRAGEEGEWLEVLLLLLLFLEFIIIIITITINNH